MRFGHLNKDLGASRLPLLEYCGIEYTCGTSLEFGGIRAFIVETALAFVAMP